MLTPVRKYIIFTILTALVFCLDQGNKWLVLEHIPAGNAITVIPGIMDLVHYRNRGAAFGFLNRSDIEWQFWLFLGATLVAMVVIFLLLRQAGKTTLVIGLALLFGGALGNLADRMRYHSVVDFLDFYWHGWHWPAFNVADMAICCGAFLTCLTMWKQGNAK